jgi:hypothetical protein
VAMGGRALDDDAGFHDPELNLVFETGLLE